MELKRENPTSKDTKESNTKDVETLSRHLSWENEFSLRNNDIDLPLLTTTDQKME